MEPHFPALDAVDDLADLFENAPCGYLVIEPTGRITRVNGTFSRWVERAADDLVGIHLRDLLTVPARIFYETNFAPLLHLQDGFEEVALEMVTAAGRKLPLLVNALGRRDPIGDLVSVRLALFRAGDRRNYERDLQGREAIAVRSLEVEKAQAELREQFIAVLVDRL
jgi:sigma-B regulation protein RsbU (phosphoserine phosphatase)